MEGKQIKKHFFSSEKELKWLNQLGQQGFRLIDVESHTYSFEEDEFPCYYSMEWLDSSPESEQMIPYLKSQEEKGYDVITSDSLWVYYISDRQIHLSPEAILRTVKHYRNPAIFLYICSAICCILTGYHLCMRDFLESYNMIMATSTYSSSKLWIETVFNRIMAGLGNACYYYAQLWKGLFGDTVATEVVAFSIPCALILAAIASFWFSEYLIQRKQYREARRSAKAVPQETIDEEEIPLGE